MKGLIKVYDSENRCNMAENVEPWDKVGVNQQNVTSDRSFVSQMSRFEMSSFALINICCRVI